MEPIIITAFWDVGRSTNCAITRTNERYYQEFAAWSRIKNRMIIYTDPVSKDKISQIRNQYGLGDKTEIVVVEDIFDVEPVLYIKMKKIEENGNASFKFNESAMSNRANFDYAWMMKYWCISDASKRVENDDLLAWMDFGFNHLDVCYDRMEQFDFIWNCEINMKKIHLFALRSIDDIELIDVLQFQTDILMGVFHLIPVFLAEQLWKLVKQAMNSLLMLQCIDDDQMLLLMACKSYPELFEIHISNWFLPLKENGAGQLVTRDVEKHKVGLRAKISKLRKKIDFIKRILYRLKKIDK